MKSPFGFCGLNCCSVQSVQKVDWIRWNVGAWGPVGPYSDSSVCVEMLVILKLRFNRLDPQLSGVAPRFFMYICVYHIIWPDIWLWLYNKISLYIKWDRNSNKLRAFYSRCTVTFKPLSQLNFGERDFDYNFIRFDQNVLCSDILRYTGWTF
jgi:hypothetical protein